MGINLAPLIEKTTDIEIILFEENKNPDAKAHIVSPPENPHLDGPGLTAKDIVDLARARGEVVKALCGYKWIPRHNPEGLPACQICFDIAGMLMRNAGE